MDDVETAGSTGRQMFLESLGEGGCFMRTRWTKQFIS